jgi:hypothetical protein
MVGPHTRRNAYPPISVINIPIKGHCVRRKHIVLIAVKGYNKLLNIVIYPFSTYRKVLC